MLKYMITCKCNRHCEYCITRNIHRKQASLCDIFKVLLSTSLDATSIMLTGGEPTLADHFETIAEFVLGNFSDVNIMTQNASFTSTYLSSRFDSIVFSLHELCEMNNVNTSHKKVFAAIMADDYIDALPKKLKSLGFAGLSINEEKREGDMFNQDRLPNIKNFSIRVNRKDHCMDETIILPDLEIITDFRPFL